MATQSPLRVSFITLIETFCLQGKSGENRLTDQSYDMRDRSREYRHVTDGQYYRRADDSMQYKRNDFPRETEYVEYVNEKENDYPS
jgi:hypothetical protein